MTGLSNRWQAIFVAASAFLIVLGTADASLPNFIPSPYRETFAVIFWFCGIIGLTLKEALGSPPPTPTP